MKDNSWDTLHNEISSTMDLTYCLERDSSRSTGEGKPGGGEVTQWVGEKAEIPGTQSWLVFIRHNTREKRVYRGNSNAKTWGNHPSSGKEVFERNACSLQHSHRAGNNTFFHQPICKLSLVMGHKVKNVKTCALVEYNYNKNEHCYIPTKVILKENLKRSNCFQVTFQEWPTIPIPIDESLLQTLLKKRGEGKGVNP